MQPLAIPFIIAMSFPLLSQVHSTTLVSKDQSGGASNNLSYAAAVSADAEFVSFVSFASDLIPGDTNGVSDIFLFDRRTFKMSRVSVSSSGTQEALSSDSPAISDDGGVVVFVSRGLFGLPGSTATGDVYVHNVSAGTTTRASVDSVGNEGNSDSFDSAISADGRFVAFSSLASNLVPGDTNGFADVFVRDTVLGATLEITVDPNWIIGNGHSRVPDISIDGGYVAFESFASNLVPGDTNGRSDVFVHELDTDTTTRVSVSSSEVQGNGSSGNASISDNGQIVAFHSSADNLVVGDTNTLDDVFVRDRTAGITIRISVDSLGGEAIGGISFGPRISRDGRWVAFTSYATNLVSNDTNGDADVFLHDIQSGLTTRVSVSSSGVEASGGLSSFPSISRDGSCVVFDSGAFNLVAQDPNGFGDVFAYDSGWTCPESITYCTAKTNSLGCVPYICSTGTASVSGVDDFFVTGVNVFNNKTGLYFWSLTPHSTPFQGGTKCVMSPIKRTGIQDSGGSPFPANDCSGLYSFHYSQSYMASKSVTSGMTIYGQYWSRDPFLAPPNNTGLTNAIEFTIAP